ncbi:MAG: hypothetical protein ACI4SR_04935 [Faecalibacillus sp.]
MLNSVSLVGKIVKTTYHIDKKAYIDIQIKKPFSLEIGKEEFDLLTIQLWKGLEEMLNDERFLNSLIAIRGRLVKKNDENYIVYAEVIELLDKHFHK